MSLDSRPLLHQTERRCLAVHKQTGAVCFRAGGHEGDHANKSGTWMPRDGEARATEPLDADQSRDYERYRDCLELMVAAQKERDGLARGALSEVLAERRRQDEKWGGHAHDDIHMADEWCGYVTEHNERALSAASIGPSHSGDTWRQQMIRVAALAVAAVESYDRRTGR